MKLAEHLRQAPIAPAQLGVAAFALADVVWVARPAAIGWLPVVRGALLAVALGAAVGFVIGALARVALAGSPGLSRPDPGAVAAAPIAAAVWIAGFAGALLWAAFRLNDPALAAWAVALCGLAALVPAAIAALVVWRLASPLSRWPQLGFWGIVGLAALGTLAAPWLRPLGLGCGALAIALLASRIGPVRPMITGIAALVGAAVALSPLTDDRAAWQARRDTTFAPAIEAMVAPLLDLDGDGRLPVFGSGDCDEGNAEISPLAIETPDNGVDEDCRFGDLEAPPPAPELGDARARAVLLITVTDLDLGPGGRLRPPMPETAKAIAAGVRFTGAQGIAGRFADVAPVLIDGRLPVELYGPHGGFSVGSQTIPAQVERAGGVAAMSATRELRGPLNTAFHLRRMSRKGKSPAKVARRHARILSRRPGFVWIHLDGRRRRDEVDAAVAGAIARAIASPDVAALLVGLPSAAPEPEIGGGPLALIAGDLEARADDRPAGLHDVYPTLAELLGLEIGPVAGTSLLAEADRPALAGVIDGGVARLGAFDRSGWVRHQSRALRFESSAGTFAEDAEGPDAVAELARATRRRLLAPRLAARNRRRDARIEAPLPDDRIGTPTTIARALTFRGCSIEHRRGGVIIDAYFGGVGLEADDLFAFKLFAPGATSIRGRVQPAVPLSQLEPGALYRQRFDIDTRSLGDGAAFLWLGVFRDGRLLPVTSGSGATPRWALVCRVEPPARGGGAR